MSYFIDDCRKTICNTFNTFDNLYIRLLEAYGYYNIVRLLNTILDLVKYRYFGGTFHQPPFTE